MSTRYTIVLDEGAARDLERLKESFRLKTKADVFDLSTTVLLWAAQQLADGYEIGRAKDDAFQPLLLPKTFDKAAWSGAKELPEGLQRAAA
jgi:hypothetical protein